GLSICVIQAGDIYNLAHIKLDDEYLEHIYNLVVRWVNKKTIVGSFYNVTHMNLRISIYLHVKCGMKLARGTTLHGHPFLHPRKIAIFLKEQYNGYDMRRMLLNNLPIEWSLSKKQQVNGEKRIKENINRKPIEKDDDSDLLGEGTFAKIWNMQMEKNRRMVNLEGNIFNVLETQEEHNHEVC
ncbi:hypothetical protein ACJX0J_019060, partial [Zea mays]